jgi:phosphoribosyl 1,2-cyclic phosphodiesterase
MPSRFTVLASGSGGNASLLEVDGFGLLLDAGLGPRQLTARMAVAGASWERVHAVLLTHTHGDHWKERTLAHLRRRRIPLYRHPTHDADLLACGDGFAGLCKDGLVRAYEHAGAWEVAPGLRAQPLRLPHDAADTFGFRFDGPGWSLAYITDLGSWTPELAHALRDVDVLAVEFNHDLEMEYASGRSPQLIARVLGPVGHLSNDQAAGLLQHVIGLSTSGRLRHVVQLHLSRQCNHPSLAAEAAQAVLDGLTEPVQVHTASQFQTGPIIVLDGAAEAGPWPGPHRRRAGKPAPGQAWLPGWDR